MMHNQPDALKRFFIGAKYGRIRKSAPSEPGAGVGAGDGGARRQKVAEGLAGVLQRHTEGGERTTRFWG